MKPDITSMDSILTEVKILLDTQPGRIILGIVGKPGAGKSTVTDHILKNLEPGIASLVPMDGYHLSNKILHEHNSRDRKGAPDTFDALGYIALLTRVKENIDQDIYFPVFHREFEESYGAEGVVRAGTRLVLTEGNYLLLQDPPWAGVFPMLTECWYLAPEEKVRLERLIIRHLHHGHTQEEADFWTYGSDERNAQTVARTVSLATRSIKL